MQGRNALFTVWNYGTSKEMADVELNSNTNKHAQMRLEKRTKKTVKSNNNQFVSRICKDAGPGMRTLLGPQSPAGRAVSRNATTIAGECVVTPLVFDEY